METTTAFKDKTLMITGGTGSFGNTVLKHFMHTDLAEIRIFSRDEKKQDDMRHRLQEKSPELAGKVRFFIGDVRNPQSVRDAMHGVDYIFHAAALKQVPSCEFFPMEAVRTNVIGTDNVLHAAIDEGVDRVVCLSTDKAAYPINAMGKSKAMMESIIYANARNGAGRTTICCTRYGNVMCSRGSVIPLFIDRIRKGEPLTVTDPSMTRFLMNLDEAVDLVQFAFEPPRREALRDADDPRGAPARRGHGELLPRGVRLSRPQLRQVRGEGRREDPGRRVLHLAQHRAPRRRGHRREDQDRRVRAAGS